MDGVEDPLITAILDNLGHANDTGLDGGAPTTAFQMARLIVDTCVGFFDREFRMKLEDQHDWGKPANWKGSVQDVFTNAIAKAVRTPVPFSLGPICPFSFTTSYSLRPFFLFIFMILY